MGEGISLLQSIVDGYTNSGRYDGNIHDFTEKISSLTGVPVVKPQDISGFPASSDPVEKTAVQTKGAAGAEKSSVEKANIPAAEENRIQDESLLRDFIAEGLEYIEEIEINILNLEKIPRTKIILTPFSVPFTRSKGWQAFSTLIRSATWPTTWKTCSIRRGMGNWR